MIKSKNGRTVLIIVYLGFHSCLQKVLRFDRINIHLSLSLLESINKFDKKQKIQ